MMDYRLYFQKIFSDWALGFFIFSLTLLWLLKNDLQLATDGVEHLRLTLTHGNIFSVSDRRLHAYWLTQWPVQILLRAGIEDLEVFKRAYAFGIFALFIMPVAFLFISKEFAKSKAQILPVYFILVGAVAYPSAYLIGTEHQTILPLTFLISCILANYEKNSVFVNIVGILTLFLLTKTYETSVAPLTIFFIFAIFYFVKNINTNSHKIFLLIFIVICAIGIENSIIGIINPRDAKHRDGFLTHLSQGIRNPVFITFLICMIAIVFAKIKNILCVVFLVLAFTYQIYCWLNPKFYQNIAQLSFASRTLNFLIVSPMVIFILLKVNLEVNGKVSNVVIFILGASVVLLSNPFLNFKEKLQSFSNANTGFVNSKKHQLANHPASWNWTFPSLSIVWQSPCVRTVLLNADPKLWQPYDPEKELGFGNFSSYIDGLYSVEKNKKICEDLSRTNKL